MSTAPAEYEQLLRQAISQARKTAPRAMDDLLRFSSQAAQAVAEVTGGNATLDLIPINQVDGATQAYQLQLRKFRSDAPPSDLGVYCLADEGYPVLRWYSRRTWESRRERPDEEFRTVNELEGNFRWMVSHPDSRLVLLVSFFQQNTSASTNSVEGGA